MKRLNSDPGARTTHRFENVLLTGATSGIGEALAIRFAQIGAKNVFFCGRDSARLNSVSNAIVNLGAVAHPAQINVRDESAMKAWIESADAEAPLDLVFANAGVATDVDDEPSNRATFAVNVGGVVNTVLPAISIFRNSKKPRLAKRIAITSSMTGYHGMPQCPAYSATKACVKAWGAALRGSLRAEGIAVTTVCPGFVRSRITDKNTCPMPFFMEAPAAAAKIVSAIEKGKGLVSFPWQMRIAMKLVSVLPEFVSERVFRLLPDKT